MRVNVRTATHAIQLAKSAKLSAFLVWTGICFQEISAERIYNWAVEKAKYGRDSDRNKIRDDSLYAIFIED